MKKNKPEVKIEGWSTINGRLVGVVHGHPSLEDGEGITTSTVVSPPDSIKQGGVVETKNTIYKLGKSYKPHKKENQ